LIVLGFYKAEEDTIEGRIGGVVEATAEIALAIQKGCKGASIEAEVVDDKYSLRAASSPRFTDPDEACAFVRMLNEQGVDIDLVAIYNGYGHGADVNGEKTIDLVRTRRVADALLEFDPPVAVAQHGTTDTPVDIIKGFSDAGIVKANVFTEFARIVYNNLPHELQENIGAAALDLPDEKKAGLTDDQVVGKYFRNFLYMAQEGDLSVDVTERITEDTKQETVRLIEFFRSENTAGAFRE